MIDRSGSMNDVWQDVKGGFSSFIKENKEAKGEATFSLYSFDDEFDTLHNFTNIQDVSEELSVFPRGMTALFDALGKAIVETGEKLAAMKESERPQKVLFVIQTDGHENASSEYTAKRLAEMIKTQEETFNWEFLFLGAGMEFLDQAANIGLAKKFVGYNTSNSGYAFAKAGNKVATYRSASHDGTVCCDSAAFSYSEEEKEELLKEDKD